MEKKIALFGGAFNPPHGAHRQVAGYLAGLPQFDEVWIVPVFDHPFDKDLVPYDDRVAMCRLTVAGLGPKVSVCNVEGEMKKCPSYTIDAIQELKRKFPKNIFTIVVGSDCRQELNKWKNIESLKKEADFFFVPRPGIEESPFMDISSTGIRDLIRKGKSTAKYLVPKVAKYIEKNKLYKV